jgi:sulfatase maturation enzyme AslB (radical SAM superfamily)
MFNEREPREYHGAIVDLTDRCNLRCRHCFYYRNERDSEELPSEELLRGLETLRDRHDIRSMEWCGGEPLVRREVFEAGAALFPHNMLYTNGTQGIPKIGGVTVCVSLDGPPKLHDYIRGDGCFERIAHNLAGAESQTVVILCTLNRPNAPYLEEFLQSVERLERPGLWLPVFLLIFTPLKRYRDVTGYEHTAEQRDRLALSWEERDRLLEEIARMRRKHPDRIQNSDLLLELMHSSNASYCIERCNRSQVTLTLDLRLERKLPCVLGPDVDCARCGCPFPYEREARKRGQPSTTGAIVPASVPASRFPPR